MADHHRGNAVIAVSVGAGIIESVAVALRLLARWRGNVDLASDDYCLIASLLPSYLMMVCGGLMVTKGGIGRPLNSLSHAEIVVLLKALIATLVTYAITVTLVKVSILLLYRRIFITRTFRFAATATGFLCILWCIAAILIDIFQCRPVQAAWDPGPFFTNGCINFRSFYQGLAAVNLILDVMIFTLPVHMVWRLNLSTKGKVTSTSIFMLGGLCFAGAMRMVALGDIHHADLSLTLTNAYIWSQLEPSIAIICASILTCKALLKDIKLWPGRCRQAMRRQSDPSERSLTPLPAPVGSRRSRMFRYTPSMTSLRSGSYKSECKRTACRTRIGEVASPPGTPENLVPHPFADMGDTSPGGAETAGMVLPTKPISFA